MNIVNPFPVVVSLPAAVARIGNLLYRRVSRGKPLEARKPRICPWPPQNAIPRYRGAQLRATRASAILLMVISVSPASQLTASAQSQFHNFVTRRGDQLYDGDQPYRFISWNVPNLHLIEDRLDFTATNAWRLPNRFELVDALSTVRQMGGTVVRTYAISVVRSNDPPAEASDVLGPGKFNEEAFRSIDELLRVANEEGVRIIIPLVNNWIWMGGRGEYAEFRGKGKDAFWTDPQLIADFEQTIRFVLLRTNTLTGVRYCDDKAVMCWETGNELASPPAWTEEIARYIKRIDPNHLVMDGYAAALRPEVLAMPEVDIVTTHHYPSGRRFSAQIIRDNAAKTKGVKAYVVGEFGFFDTDKMEETMKAVIDSGAAGGLLWSLRFRDRDGGFYWHSEPDGGNLYKAFHWPGSPIGAPYDEIHLMALERKYAYEIRGMDVPPIPVPAPPRLLPIADVAAITWQGSVGANDYNVECAPRATGPWTVVGRSIDESRVQYRPLFADESRAPGEWYYRVRAENSSGISEPSNIVGPVKVTTETLVDELADFSKVHRVVGTISLQTRDTRKAKEDANRAAGIRGDALVYSLPGAVRGFRVYALFPGAVSDLKFSVSKDGMVFRRVDATSESYSQGAGDYNYWSPVLYRGDGIDGAEKYFMVELTGSAQIGRVEITHEPGPQ